jgi:glycosyltransferase involved in cell wall biosynthesis
MMGRIATPCLKTAVIIPLYNHEAYIGAALESVFAQSRPVDRVVIVDDGSTDGSLERVRGFQDPRITLLSQPNAGAHNTLNRAIAEAADCQWVAVLNSDDFFHPERIKKCVGFLEAHPGVEVVCSALKLVDPDGSPLEESAPKARWASRVWAARCPDLPEWLGIANFAKTSSNFVGRQSYFAAHPFRNYRFVHDYFFALQCALHGQLAVIDEELLFYRTHPTNTIKSVGTEHVKLETLRMNADLLRELAPDLAASAQVRLACANYFRSLLGNHADFRSELFFSLLAQVLAQAPPDSSLGLLAAMSPQQFPELLARSSPDLKERLAREKRFSSLLNSTWLRLGRKLGFISA